jgi:F-type H+-transporting ATPase subunit gamma
MATLREIKSRIGSIKNIEKITRAMKMVASVKFRKAQMNVVAARPYARKIADILMHLIPVIEDMDNELLKPREVKKVCMVIVAGDRGLSGSFNANLIKAAQASINKNYSEYLKNADLTLITIGRKVFSYFNKREYDIFANCNRVQGKEVR